MIIIKKKLVKTSNFWQELSNFPNIYLQFLIYWIIQQILTPTFSFFIHLRGFFKLCFQHVMHEQVRVWAGVCTSVCVGVRGYARVCVWDEFSDYLLETRFLTSANYNTHPLRIFFKNPGNRDIFYSKTIPGFVRISTIEDPL